MEMKTTVHVMQAKRFRSDDGNFAATTLYCQGEAITETPASESIGLEIVKMRGEYELLDSLRGMLPGKLELTVVMAQGGKDKAEIRVLSAKPAGK